MKDISTDQKPSLAELLELCKSIRENSMTVVGTEMVTHPTASCHYKHKVLIINGRVPSKDVTNFGLTVGKFDKINFKIIMVR